jgi:hypothetical protein
MRAIQSPLASQAPLSDAEEPITVATFSLPMEAQLARMRLESEGVPVYVQSMNLASVNWLMSNALGGIQVQVPPSEAIRARQILADNPVTAEVPEVVCPKCGSPDVRRAKLSWRLSMLSTHLLSVPLPFTRENLRCTKCGHVWSADDT